MMGPVFKHGSFIRFTYPPSTQDKFKEIFVLHPNWQGKTHGIDMKRLTEAERLVLRTVMDPDAQNKVHRIPLINDILRRMDPPELINNPISFYNQFVKVFLRNKDAYRTYKVESMSAVQIIKASEVKGKLTNPAPLFGKPLGSK